MLKYATMYSDKPLMKLCPAVRRAPRATLVTFFAVLFGATVDLAFFRSLCRVLSCGVLPSTIGRPRFGLSQILSVASLRLF